jgi:hypothetical protein
LNSSKSKSKRLLAFTRMPIMALFSNVPVKFCYALIAATAVTFTLSIIFHGDSTVRLHAPWILALALLYQLDGLQNLMKLQRQELQEGINLLIANDTSAELEKSIAKSPMLRALKQLHEKTISSARGLRYSANELTGSCIHKVCHNAPKKLPR